MCLCRVLEADPLLRTGVPIVSTSQYEHRCRILLQSRIILALWGWVGRLVLGPTRSLNLAICSADAVNGSRSTIHRTPSEHGGVVNEPS